MLEVSSILTKCKSQFIVSSQKSILCSAALGQSFKGILVLGKSRPTVWRRASPQGYCPLPGQLSFIPYLTAPPAFLLLTVKKVSHLKRELHLSLGEPFLSPLFRKRSIPYRSHSTHTFLERKTKYITFAGYF